MYTRVNVYTGICIHSICIHGYMYTQYMCTQVYAYTGIYTQIHNDIHGCGYTQVWNNQYMQVNIGAHRCTLVYKFVHTHGYGHVQLYMNIRTQVFIDRLKKRLQ